MSTRTGTLERVFRGIPHTYLRGASDDSEVSSIEFSSKDVEEGSLFFCVPGTKVDGHSFAADALSRGAAALVVEHELDVEAPQVLVDDSRTSLALASANFYGNPSEKLSLVGVTGTKGKTTTTYLVEHIAQTAGQKAGLMGTVECHVGEEVRPSLHTTPESRDLQEMLADMVDSGVEVAALEVSSHALDLGRVDGVRFAVAAFTNLSQDHLDYHETMENYFEAKALLFTEHAPEHCVVCVDDAAGREMARRCEELGRDLVRVSASDTDGCDVRVERAVYAPHSTDLTLSVRGEELSLTLPLVGRFNVENAVVASGVALALGYPVATLVEALASAPQVPGRLQRVIGRDGTVPPFGVLVDYAHTDDSISKAIGAVKAVTEGRVICVFGCGGDRDHGKRPKMGRAALSADLAVVTTDNPRTEDPLAIIEQILPGMEGEESRYYVKPDREEAIKFALHLARPGDAVLIVGKGHEDYQIVGTEKRHFDDREVAAAEIEEL